MSDQGVDGGSYKLYVAAVNTRTVQILREANSSLEIACSTKHTAMCWPLLDNNRLMMLCLKLDVYFNMFIRKDRTGLMQLIRVCRVF